MDAAQLESEKVLLSKELRVLKNICSEQMKRGITPIDHSLTNLRFHLTEIVTLILDSGSNANLRQILDAKTSDIRTVCEAGLATIMDYEQRIGRNLFHEYKWNIERNRNKRYWLTSSKSLAQITLEQNAVQSRLISETENITALEFSQWREQVDSFFAAVEFYMNLNVYMSNALREDRKFRDDLFRAKAARWSILIAVIVAALGQTDDAINNLRALASIDYSIFFSKMQSIF